MYGGVSLAIYMNGIAQELLRMVRATATKGKTNKPLVSYRDLDPVERAYRKIAYCRDRRLEVNLERRLLEQNAPLPRTFTIDIISGTSAGGINGIFLAKALANGQKMDVLKNLWITEGDVGLLINDRKSVRGTGLDPQREPQSLFNSRRMYQKLLAAFESMENAGTVGDRPDEESGDQPFVSNMDLFVTATDILGLTLPIRLSDSTVYEREHRTVFRFSFSRGDRYKRPWNDFRKDNNPMLAFAARCTSSFPFAFEPMRLCDIDEVLKSMRYSKQQFADSRVWKRFFRGYPETPPPGTVSYRDRPFGDGGYLDNKPFTYAIETINERHSIYPFERKLLYIEPAPEHPEREKEKAEKPDAIENSFDALLRLPRKETIRTDIEKILERNRLSDRIERIIRDIEQDKCRALDRLHAAKVSRDEPLWSKPGLNDSEWGELDLSDLVNRKGTGYVAYFRLEIAAVTDDFGRLLARVAGFREDSEYFLVFRNLVRAWRESAYAEYRESGLNQGPGKPTLTAFLHSFDLTFPLRRLKYLRRQIDRLCQMEDERLLEEVDLLLERIREKGKQEEGAEKVALESIDLFRVALVDMKKTVNECLERLMQSGRLLRSRFRPPDEETVSAFREPREFLPPSPLYGLVSELLDQLALSPEILGAQGGAEERSDFDGSPGLHAGSCEGKGSSSPDQEAVFRPVLDYFFGKGDACSRKAFLRAGGDESDSEVKAQNFLAGHAEISRTFDKIGLEVKKVLLNAIDNSDRVCRKEFGMDEEHSGDPVPLKVSRLILKSFYMTYSDVDRIVFPLLYGSGMDEPGQVDVFRISPEDATALVDERRRRLRKLAGTSLGNFGGFMEKRWRQNDIMWGQLDGAERIIRALMPDRESARQFIGEAQAAIVQETIHSMGRKEAFDLLVEPFMRPQDGKPDPDSVTDFVAALKDRAGDVVRTGHDREYEFRFLNDRELRDHYLRRFRTNSELEPESALKNAARATTVTGKILSGISENYEMAGRRYVSLLTRGGTFLTWLVEAAVPRSMWRLIVFHWLKLLYLLEAVLMAGSYLLVSKEMQRFTLTAFMFTVSTHVVIAWLNSLMLFRKRWGYLIRGFAVMLVTLLLVSGAVFIYLATEGKMTLKVLSTVLEASLSMKIRQP
jgi:patatin-related protein